MIRNKTSSVETGSPLWVKDLLGLLGHKFAAHTVYLSNSMAWERFLGVATAVLLFLISAQGFYYQGELLFHQFNFFGWYVFTLRIFGVIFLVTAISPNLKEFLLKSPLLVAGSWVGVYFLVAFMSKQEISFFLFLSGISILCLILWIGLFAISRCSAKVRLAVYFFFLIFTFFLPSFSYFASGIPGFRSEAFYFKVLLFMAPIFVEGALLGKISGSLNRGFLFAFSPIQYLYQFLPMPTELSDSPISLDSARKGILDIWLGLCLYGFLYFSNSILPGLEQAHTPWEIFTRGWINYLLYYFGFSAALLTTVGMFRWLGLSLEDPLDYPLIASNFVDRWKRWNYYFYWFYLTFVWLPVLRSTKNIFLATISVFLLNFIWHNVNPINRYFCFPGSAQNTEYVVRQFLFFLAHALVLYVSFAFPAIFPKDSKRAGWFGVAFLHFGMAWIYAII